MAFSWLFSCLEKNPFIGMLKAQNSNFVCYYCVTIYNLLDDIQQGTKWHRILCSKQLDKPVLIQVESLRQWQHQTPVICWKLVLNFLNFTRALNRFRKKKNIKKYIFTPNNHWWNYFFREHKPTMCCNKACETTSVTYEDKSADTQTDSHTDSNSINKIRFLTYNEDRD